MVRRSPNEVTNERPLETWGLPIKRPPSVSTSPKSEHIQGNHVVSTRKQSVQVKPFCCGAPPVVGPGTVFGGRYVVTGILGEGAMGKVYKATHQTLQRRCAIKVIGVDRYDQKLEKRFIREARSLACIESPWVAQVSDFGYEPNVGLYYVMEFVEGETLEDRLKRHKRLLLPRQTIIKLQTHKLKFPKRNRLTQTTPY